MSKESDFLKFLGNIEPSKTTKEYISSIHTNLRDYLSNHEKYKEKVKETFLTGSYAKHTCIRPSKYYKKADVDIVVVTNYTNLDNSKDVLDELYEILNEEYTNVTKQKRSIGIEMSGIEIDVVPMIEKAYSELLQIGDNKGGAWIDTNPKGHLSWCTDVNKSNNQKFVPLVKIFKWWRKTNCPDTIKYPKGITLEKIIADNIADCSENYESIVYNTFKNIRNSFKYYIDLEVKPPVYDPGISSNNLSNGYEFKDFKSFYNKIVSNIKLLEDKSFSNGAWREVLGSEFPVETKSLSESISNIRNIFNVSHRQAPEWYMDDTLVPSLDIKVKCTDKYKNHVSYDYDGFEYLDKNIHIDFEVVGESILSPNINAYWQVVNTGEEAKEANCMRGEFNMSNHNRFGRTETTAYSGTHWVQAFLVKDKKCIAKSKEILVRINK